MTIAKTADHEPIQSERLQGDHAEDAGRRYAAEHLRLAVGIVVDDQALPHVRPGARLALPPVRHDRFLPRRLDAGRRVEGHPLVRVGPGRPAGAGTKTSTQAWAMFLRTM